MTEKKLLFGLGRFFPRTRGAEVSTPLPSMTQGDLFRPEESIVSFYVASSDPEEKIRQQLTEQIPDDPEKRERIILGIREARDKRQAS